MNKIYNKKENKYWYYLLLILGVGLIIFGWLLVEYFAWQAFFIIGIAIPKIIAISKNPISPVIELNDEGVKLLSVADTPFYMYANISAINMNSKAVNGYIRLKDAKKKIQVDSVAIDLKDQREICEFVNKKINLA